MLTVRCSCVYYVYRVDLCLSKQSEAMWPEVVTGDTRGEMLADPAEVAAIHERLAHLTSEQWVSCVTRITVIMMRDVVSVS